MSQVLVADRIEAGPRPLEQAAEDVKRLRLMIRGAVQGVGFRPCVYRVATELGLSGWVMNGSQGVTIELEGAPESLECFRSRLECAIPPRAAIYSCESLWLDPVGYRGFAIQESENSGKKTAVVLPDISTCADCLRELFDASDRRHRYPFINCTNCGPRYSIIGSLPYDRARTTMHRFAMCACCQAEYTDPLNRRFHAQPNACPRCGPRLELWDAQGTVLTHGDGALRAAVEAIRQGDIVAIKGLGGFHLMADARNVQAVGMLRRRKHREEKPFALMYRSLKAVRAACEVSVIEARLLRSPECPIVLLRRRHGQADVADAVAPGNPYLGVMLPYTPLQHLLMAALDTPAVATSGNRSDEPICTDEREALTRLQGLAEVFLVHNRPIARAIDDSIVLVLMGRELVLRRARGYAPLPIPVRGATRAVIAVGAHVKNAIAASVGGGVVLSQHVGDLETAQATEAFEQTMESLTRLYELAPAAVACDAHPDYRSSHHAARMGLPVVRVQHHYAHVLACMAENELEPPVLGVAWDGTGYGFDGTIWGGEFLRITRRGFDRLGHFRTFPLPGGEQAIREPRRAALGLLFELFGESVLTDTGLPPVQACTSEERHALRTMLTHRVNTPRTSSAGRLFDAVSSLVGLRQINRYEGQAAMELEYAMEDSTTAERYPIRLVYPGGMAQAGCMDGPPGPMVIDWAPMLLAIMDDRRRKRPVPLIAAKFHHSLVEAAVLVAGYAQERRVVLTGGCFQNRRLTEAMIQGLRRAGLTPYWHQRVPPNDGGIALGQVVAASRMFTAG